MFYSVCENSTCEVGNAGQYGSLNTEACQPLPVTPSTRDKVEEQKKQICDGNQVEKGAPLYVEDFDTELFRDRIIWRQVSGHINGAQQRMLELEPEAIPGMW